MNTVVIGVSSSTNPIENIIKAKNIILEKHDLKNDTRLIVTKPIGYEDQPDFTNATFLIQTKVSREELGNSLKQVEGQFGSIRTENNDRQPTIDLDILVWNDKIVDDKVYERDFLMDSILELIPDLKKNI